MASSKRRENKKLHQRRRRVKPAPSAQRSREVLLSLLRPPAREPSVLDQIGTFISEPELGLPETDAAGLRVYARELPFEPAMFYLAKLNLSIEPTLPAVERQWSLAQQFYVGRTELLKTYSNILRQAPRRAIFSPQAIAMLMRVLIEEATDEPLRDLTATEIEVMRTAVLGAHSVLETALDATPVADRDTALAYELQGATYFLREPPLEAMTRQREFLRLAAEDPRLHGSDNRVDVLAWLAATGLSADEQFAVGFGLSALTNAFDDTPVPRVTADIVDDLLTKLKLGQADRTLPALSADRATFRARFTALGGGDAAYAWETRPFKSTPLLRLDDGDVLLLGSSWLLSWLGEGFHYRLMTRAQEEGRDELLRYTRFAGEITERYALNLTEAAAPPHVRVLGDQPYRLNGDQRTSDVAMVWGSDLILFEVHARRVPTTAAVAGTALAATTEVSKLIVKKVDQLGRCVGHLLSGAAKLPDVDIGSVERVWPVVVTIGHVLQSPHLWDYIHASKSATKTASFADSRVEALQVLDIGDFERQMGLVSAGHELPRMLARKVGGPYRERDLSVWLREDPEAPSDQPRVPALEARWQEMSDRVIHGADMSLGSPSEQDAGSPLPNREG
jgi:hypothetical protein